MGQLIPFPPMILEALLVFLDFYLSLLLTVTMTVTCFQLCLNDVKEFLEHAKIIMTIEFAGMLL